MDRPLSSERKHKTAEDRAKDQASILLTRSEPLYVELQQRGTVSPEDAELLRHDAQEALSEANASGNEELIRRARAVSALVHEKLGS